MPLGEVRGTIKKLINDPTNVVDEMLDGFVSAHSNIVTLASPRVIARVRPAQTKVGMTIGGGSGHEPAMVGYVGVGLADTAAAAQEASAMTANLVARVGRASRLAERSAGTVAGARSFAIVLGALADAYAAEKAMPSGGDCRARC